jgi:hypothetical protein
MSDTSGVKDQSSPPLLADGSAILAAHLSYDLIRVEGAEGVDIVERLRESHADKAGRAFVLRLDPLIVRLGARWAQKADIVWEHLKDAFTRRFEEPNWCVKINEDAWLAIIPAYGARKGALSVAEIWMELCDFFIGALSAVAPPLFEVHADGVDRLKLIPIDIKTYFDRDETTAANAARIRPLGQVHEPATRPQPTGPHMVSLERHSEDTTSVTETQTAAHDPGPSPVMKPMGNRPVMVAAMVAYAGRALKVASAVEPLFEMKKMVMIGHRLEPLVMENADNALLDRKALANMDWNLREQVDITNMEQGLNLLRMRDPDQRKMVMLIPAAFSTFAAARARAKITQDAAKAATELGLKVLFEVRGLDGVPPHRVLEIVSMIKPFCMTVVGSVSPERKAIANLAKCGLSGVSVEYDGAKRDDAMLNEYLSGLSTAAKAAAGACMVQGFDNYRQMAVARISGVTHASIKAAAMMSPRAAGNAPAGG